MKSPSVQTSGLLVSGVRHNRAIPEVMVHRLTSLRKTAVAAGSAQTIILANASESTALYKIARDFGGIPIAVGLVVKIIQEISNPVEAGSTVDVYAPMIERRADDTILLTPGLASEDYNMGVEHTVDRWIWHTREFMPSIVNACMTSVSENATTNDRARVDMAGNTLYGSNDSLIDLRALFSDGGLRKIWNNSGAPVVSPATGEPFADCIVIPLTNDGTHGVRDTGMLAIDLFNKEMGQWQFIYTPRNRTTLYPDASTVSGGTVAPTFGTFTIEVDLIYRVHVADVNRPPLVGTKWRWNDNLPKFDATTGQMNIAASQLRRAFFVGNTPRHHDATVDSASEFMILGDAAGGSADFTPTIHLIPPSISPALFYAQTNYLKITSGTDVEFPQGDYTNMRAIDFLTQFNDRFRRDAACEELGPLGGQSALQRHPAMRELPLYGGMGERTASYSRFVTYSVAALRYGTTYAAGAAVSTFTAPNRSVREVHLGGIQCIPELWCDLRSKGFPGMGSRFDDSDNRPVSLQPNGAYVLPSFLVGASAQQWPTTAFFSLEPYGAVQSGQPDCSPCNAFSNYTPLAANPNSAAKDEGDLLSLTWAMTPGAWMKYLQSSGFVAT